MCASVHTLEVTSPHPDPHPPCQTHPPTLPDTPHLPTIANGGHATIIRVRLPDLLVFSFVLIFQRMLDRARQRRQNLDRKMAETTTPRKRQANPLSENRNNNIPSLTNVKDDGKQLHFSTTSPPIGSNFWTTLGIARLHFHVNFCAEFGASCAETFPNVTSYGIGKLTVHLWSPQCCRRKFGCISHNNNFCTRSLFWMHKNFAPNSSNHFRCLSSWTKNTASASSGCHRWQSAITTVGCA